MWWPKRKMDDLTGVEKETAEHEHMRGRGYRAIVALQLVA